MSNDLQTRDKQNRDVDSSEQYAINVIGVRALQSANLVVKESKRVVEKAVGGKSVLPRPASKQDVHSSTPRQIPTVEVKPPEDKIHTPVETSKRQEEKGEPVFDEPYGQYHAERQGQFFSIADDIPDEAVPIYVEPESFSAEEKPAAEGTSIPALSRNRRYPTPQKMTRRQNDTSPRSTGSNFSRVKSEDSPHMQGIENNLRLSEESSLTTWESRTDYRIRVRHSIPLKLPARPCRRFKPQDSQQEMPGFLPLPMPLLRE